MAFIEVSDKLKAQLEAVVAEGRAQSVGQIVETAVLGLMEERVRLTEEGYEILRKAIAEADAGEVIELRTKEEHQAFWDDIRAMAQREADLT